MTRETATTYGYVHWDPAGAEVHSVDVPVSPEGDGWRLVSTCTGEMRFSRQPIFWTWERET